MKNSKKINSTILFKDERSIERFIGNLQHAANSFNNIAKCWNNLGVSKFDKDCLSNIQRKNFFIERFFNERNVGIENSTLPQHLKEQLKAEAYFPEDLNNLVERLDNLGMSLHRWSIFTSFSGTKAYEIKPEYFLIENGEVKLIKSIEEVITPEFSLNADTKEKVEAFQKLVSLVEILNDTSKSLKDSGLHNSAASPIIGTSELINYDPVNNVFELQIVNLL